MVETNGQETSPAAPNDPAPNVPAPDSSAPDERHPEDGFTARCTKPPEAPEPEPQQQPDDGVPPAGPVTLKRTNGRKVVVVIDGEFRTRLRDQTEQERAAMERNLLRDRFVVVTVWPAGGRLVVLDGHRGLATCLRHGIPVLLREVKLRDRAAARRWIDDNQSGRRNLTREEQTYHLGRLYNRAKLPHGGRHKGRGSSAKNRHSKTADALAERYHVAASTVRIAGNYAAGLDKIAAACGQGPKQLILGGDSGLTQHDVVELVRENPRRTALRKAVLSYLSEQPEPEGGSAADLKAPAKRKKPRAKKEADPAGGPALTDPLDLFAAAYELLGESVPALADAAIEVLGHEASWELHQLLGERLAEAEGEAVEPPVSELLPTRRQPPGGWQGRPTPAPTNDAV